MIYGISRSLTSMQSYYLSFFIAMTSTGRVCPVKYILAFNDLASATVRSKAVIPLLSNHSLLLLLVVYLFGNTI